MVARSLLPPEQEAAFIRAYNAGKPLAEICKTYGLTAAQAYYLAGKNGQGKRGQITNKRRARRVREFALIPRIDPAARAAFVAAMTGRGCLFIEGDLADGGRVCGAARWSARPDSRYCENHHRICHEAEGAEECMQVCAKHSARRVRSSRRASG